MRVLCFALWLVVPLLSAEVVRGQLVSEAFCKEVENIVATPYSPAHWYHNIAFSNDCSLEFDIDFKGGVGIKFQIERFATRHEAEKSFRSDLELFSNRLLNTEVGSGRRKESPKHSFWNRAIYFDSDLLLLRKEKSVVTIFCDKRVHCEDIERRLRSRNDLFVF